MGLLADMCASWVNGRLSIECLLGSLESWAGQVEWPVVDTMMEVLRNLEEVLEDSDFWRDYLELCYRSVHGFFFGPILTCCYFKFLTN